MQDKIIKTIEENGVKVTIGKVLIGERKNIEIYHVRGYRAEGKAVIKEYACRNTEEEANVRAEQMLASLENKATGLKWDEKLKRAVSV